MPTGDTYLKRAEVTMERAFAAPPSRVFRAWTEPDALARWIWASLSKDVWVERDLRVGGAYRIYTHTAGGKHEGEGWSGMCGLYLVVEPDHRLTFSLQWDADMGYNPPGSLTLDEVVAVTFTPEGEDTRMRLVHLGMPDDGRAADEHRKGWGQALDTLAELVEP